MTIRLLQVASSHRIGLTNQEAELALAYRRHDELDAMVVTGENEQFQGCFSRLAENNIPVSVVRGFDEHRDLMRLIREFSLVATALKPSIVTVNTNWQMLIVGLSRVFLRSKFKTVYTIHGYRHNHKVKSFVARFLIGALLWVFADAIVAPSSYVAKRFSFLKRKIFQVPLGEDNAFFLASTSPDFNMPICFCFPGEFRAGKNQSLLIEAFIEFINISGNQESLLFLPGSGALREALMESVKESKFSNRIIFPGQLDRAGILEIYEKCQVVVVPSNSETFGHCIAEPLVLQRIVVTRPVGLAMDHIIHGVNGFIFDGKDDLVKLLTHITSMTPNALNRLSSQAKTTGEAFRWANVVARLNKEVFNPLVSS